MEKIALFFTVLFFLFAYLFSICLFTKGLCKIIEIGVCHLCKSSKYKKGNLLLRKYIFPLSPYYKNKTECTLIGEVIEEKQIFWFASDWYSESFKSGIIDWCNCKDKLIHNKDLILYSYLSYKDKKYFELLNKNKK